MHLRDKLRDLVLSAGLLAAVMAATVVQVRPAVADTSLESIVNSLNNMGYSPKQDQGAITFNAASYVVNITLSSDKTIAYVSLYYSVPADKAAKVPAVKLLNFNDTHRAYAFVSLNNQNVATAVGFNVQMAGATMSAKELRVAIDSITGAASEQQSIINPANW